MLAMSNRARLAATALCLFATTACSRSSRAAGALGKPLVCPVSTSKVVAAPGNPQARKAAQRGLDYLAHASEAWTEQHKCFGCHVQAVTLEALTVGKHHQYDVQRKDVDEMVRALLMGANAGGHTTGVAFEGQAWARYDQWLDGQHTGELLRYGNELITLQRADGSIPDDDARLPVTGGTMHTTYQAMQTWRQAFARSADDKWLAPMRKAEKYLAMQSGQWNAKSDIYLQNVNLALLGLVAAGVGPSEESSLRLQKILLARQNQDGGWGLDKSQSDGLATGQTLYTLKLAGHTDGESAIERGTSWLVAHQAADGAWRTVRSGQGGAEKGEGMWAVLGLVSVDVMSVNVVGLVDGQHVEPTMNLTVEARDNQAGGVSKVELFVDDLPLAGQCAPRLTQVWSTRELSEGKHIVDVVATNKSGKQSRRRFEVYAGNVFLTEVGTRFDEVKGATEVTVRNIAPATATGDKVALEVFAVEGTNNKPGKKVWSSEQAGAPGAMAFAWNGVGADGKAQPRGRYLAQLSVKDRSGKVVQKESALFFQDSEAAQKKQFAEVEGSLGLAGGDGVARNSTVDLVDDKGRVVQSVQSTEQGNYRFKNVASGNYHVRASKAGWTSQEAPVTAAPAEAPAKANLSFH
jgi:hypothetical protein